MQRRADRHSRGGGGGVPGTDVVTVVPPIVAIYGPTSSGKTEVAVRVAAALGTEVVNADPAQCYEGLPVLTNKPSSLDEAIALHRLVGCWPLTHEATVADYAQVAHGAIDELVASNGHAVVCGGSGLYQRAALSQLEWAGDDGQARPPDPTLRAVLDQRCGREGSAALHAQLALVDPAAAGRIHPNDRKRVVRSLEAAASGGSVAPAGGSLWDAPYRHPTLVVGLQVARSCIARRIHDRTRAMFNQRGVVFELSAVVGERAGLLDERLSATARQLHGVPDIVALLRGAIDEAEAIDRLVVRTRQYARRQDTWARRWPGLWAVPYNPGLADPGSLPADALATLVVRGGGAHAIQQVAGPR